MYLFAADPDIMQIVYIVILFAILVGGLIFLAVFAAISASGSNRSAPAPASASSTCWA